MRFSPIVKILVPLGTAHSKGNAQDAHWKRDHHHHHVCVLLDSVASEYVPATQKKWADTILVPEHQKSMVAVPAGTRQVGAPNLRRVLFTINKF